MFGWFKKGKSGSKDNAAPPPAKAGVSAAKTSSGKPSKDELIREAMKNAKAARETIGEETLNKLGEMLQKQARKAQLEKMKADLIRKMETDSERMADQIKYMMQDKDKLS